MLSVLENVPCTDVSWSCGAGWSQSFGPLYRLARICLVDSCLDGSETLMSPLSWNRHFFPNLNVSLYSLVFFEWFFFFLQSFFLILSWAFSQVSFCHNPVFMPCNAPLRELDCLVHMACVPVLFVRLGLQPLPEGGIGVMGFSGVGSRPCWSYRCAQHT